MNKLQRARREKLIQQEATADMSTIIRQQLKDNITPEDWRNGFLDMPVEELPDIFYIRPSDRHTVIWWDYAFIGRQHANYTGVRYYNEDEPFISLEDCAKLKRIYQFANPPLKNGWRSAHNPTRMPTDEDTTPYTSFISKLAPIKTDIINLIVGEDEVLLMRKPTLSYAIYCGKTIFYPFDMMMSDLLGKISTTNDWTIDPMED